MHTTNNIPSEQTGSEVVKLIRARENVYKAAKLTQGLFVLASIILPIASTFFANWDAAKPYFAFIGLCFLFLDVALLDRLQKDRIRTGAKLQEEFDTKVMGLPWNTFVAGDKVLPEDVRAASVKRLPEEREHEIVSWYESCVGDVPLHIGRLICQRTNIAYDSRLRQRYGQRLLWLTIFVGVVLLLIALAMDSTMSEVVMSVLAPFTPIMAWALREHRKQLETAASLIRLHTEFEKIWDEAINGASPEKMEIRARQLQDAIYQHRASAPLVFDWVYRRLRSKNEDEAHHAANEYVTEAKAALARQVAA